MDDRVIPITEAKASEADPLNMTQRMYEHASALLDILIEDVDGDKIKDRVTCLKYLEDIVTKYLDLKKAIADDPANAGSAVRKYASAFKNAAGRGKKGGRGRAAAADADESDCDSDDAA